MAVLLFAELTPLGGWIVAALLVVALSGALFWFVFHRLRAQMDRINLYFEVPTVEEAHEFTLQFCAALKEAIFRLRVRESQMFHPLGSRIDEYDLIGYEQSCYCCKIEILGIPGAFELMKALKRQAVLVEVKPSPSEVDSRHTGRDIHLRSRSGLTLKEMVKEIKDLRRT